MLYTRRVLLIFDISESPRFFPSFPSYVMEIEFCLRPDFRSG